MPVGDSEVRPGPSAAWYSYAIVRAVPRVERGECLNVGVILFARTADFLEARIELDEARLRALAPEVDTAQLKQRLEVFEAICAGAPTGGPISALSRSERFHWLTAPRSTMIQTSAVHVGVCHDPKAALEELLDAQVRLPGQNRQASPSG